VGTEAKQAGARANQAKTQKKTTWENPLIPNARLRQIYLAIAQTRALERALPAAKRARGVSAKTAGSFGLEAALVSAAFDLGADDLLSDALAGGEVDFLRGSSLREILQPSTTARRRSRKAAPTTAARLIAPSTIAERLWAAIGAAAALKAAHANAPAQSDESQDKPAQRSGVVVLFTLPGEAPAALWKAALTFVAKELLPIVFVALPSPRLRSGKAQSAKLDAVSAISLASGIPAIAVDADDAVAIYRVAQESIGRARSGGGAALIECIPFILHGASTAAPADALATLQSTLLQRGIATRTWIEREANSFARRIAKSKQP
jgi:TPP-dependent pyruvate/acetoin dehydrogenase alpha subunit